MRKKLLIGLAVYLACGVAFGFVTVAQDYMCSSPTVDGQQAWLQFDDGTLMEGPTGCFPVLDAGDRARWVSITTPGWLPLVIRNVVRGNGVLIGTITLGGR